jgi:hypothetical protein
MNLLERLRGDAAMLLIFASLATYVLLAVTIFVYGAWTALRPVAEAVAR